MYLMTTRRNDRPHYCNTESPSRPCCWAARKAEFGGMLAADAARTAKYGRSSCKGCGQVYAVVDGVCEDHVCQGISEFARGGS